MKEHLDISSEVPSTEGLPIQRWEGGRFQASTEEMVREVRLAIFVGETEIVRLLALPSDLEELALGYLFSEGVIDRMDDIAEITGVSRAHAVMVRLAGGRECPALDPVRSVTTGCGRGLTFVSPLLAERFPPVESAGKVLPQDIIHSMRELQRGSDLFRRTGGVHSACLGVGRDVLCRFDDIGRHNAVDKVLGWKLRRPAPALESAMLLSTGRLSSEIVIKAVRGRMPFLVSHSAPTIGAVQLAERLCVTLIGFVRGERFNVYTHPERVSA